MTFEAHDATDLRHPGEKGWEDGDLEKHLNAIHNHRLINLMVMSYEEQQRLHITEHTERDIGSSRISLAEAHAELARHHRDFRRISLLLDEMDENDPGLRDLETLHPKAEEVLRKIRNIVG